MKLNACIAFLLGSFVLPHVWASEPALVVKLVGVKNDAGNLRVGVFGDPATFRKEARAVAGVQLPARPGTVKVVFADLPPGRYAIMAYHDEDANGQLNRRFGIIPSEGYGLSNNPRVAGPPVFEDSAFDLVPGKSRNVSIDVRY